jgi:hypothetical protein
MIEASEGCAPLGARQFGNQLRFARAIATSHPGHWGYWQRVPPYSCQGFRHSNHYFAAEGNASLILTH